MTVAELLRDLAYEVVAGHSEWEIDVSILKSCPKELESLRIFGHSKGLTSNFRKKRIYVMGKQRELEEGEL